MISSLDTTEFYGQSTRPYYIGRSLAEMGANVLHLCPRPPSNRFLNTSFVALGKRKGRLAALVSVVTILHRLWSFGPDVVYAHQMHPMRLATYPARLMRKPLVFDIHGSATQELRAIASVDYERARFIRRIEQMAVNAADKVIVVSTELREFLRATFAVPEDRLVVVPNGIDLRSFRRNGFTHHVQKDRAALHIPKHNSVVAFTCPRGFPSNEIALEWFFQVVPMVESKRSDVTFLVLGGGKIIPAPSRSVVYTGFVRDLRRILAISDVCVLPYPPTAVCGGARNKALEYLAAGKPVVSTLEGMRGIKAVPGRDYLLAESREEFAQGIMDLLSDKSLAKRIASSGSLVAEQYDWRVLARRVYLVLSSLSTHSA